MRPTQVSVDLLDLVSYWNHLHLPNNFGIFTLDIRIAQLFNTFGVVFCYFIDNGRFIIKVFVL